ncbi:subtilisin-like protease SBT5.3 [Euphorbia lathyris]|uniref:subtilisin-like protease SBT5.3 n=1 Tax=Euphorbia lathyris TaxID=212925 RepID=UPI0033139791
MLFTTPSFVYYSIILLSLLHLPSYAQQQESYVVYLEDDDDSPAAGGHSIFDEQKSVAIKQNNLHVLATAFKSQNMVDAQEQLIYSYSKSINGFAAYLKTDQVEELRKNARVKSIFLNKKYKLHTTRSWNFLGLENNGASSSFWQSTKFGEDVIIGSLDTGVWPESASFNDVGLGPVPKTWKGSCSGEGDIKCNKKLIGAKYFYKGAEAGGVTMNETMMNARDYNGHGSHTLSIAGGDFVPGVNAFGFGNGTAKGGAPRARLAAYKVCWMDGCYSADILAGFDAAINDGVDIISASLGADAGTDMSTDTTTIGAFKAIKRGIVVVGSAGNSGPTPSSIENVAPWFITVAASKMDRSFLSTVILGDKKEIKGVSFSDKSLPPGQQFPLVDGSSVPADPSMTQDSVSCVEDSLDPVKVKGAIVVCSQGDGEVLKMGKEALRAGAVGMIVANNLFNPSELLAEAHLLPASRITNADADIVTAYIKSAKAPTATLTPVVDVTGVKPAPAMAFFSSRGPNEIMPEILKPDVTAPGVNILAAYSEGTSVTGLDFDERKSPYMVMSGTSMSCPHISGVAALIKYLHRDWSPAAIKSAIMTTATSLNNDGKTIGDTSGQETTPFAYGAGQVRPILAADPGLVYDMGVDDYLFAVCTLGFNATKMKTFANESFVCPTNFSLVDLNYPSITVPNLKDQIIVNRKLKNVGTPATYTSELKLPTGVTASVEPKDLVFTTIGEEKPFQLTLKSAAPGQPKDYVFGELIWSDTKHIVKTIITVKHA